MSQNKPAQSPKSWCRLHFSSGGNSYISEMNWRITQSYGTKIFTRSATQTKNGKAITRPY